MQIFMTELAFPWPGDWGGWPGKLCKVRPRDIGEFPESGLVRSGACSQNHEVAGCSANAKRSLLGRIPGDQDGRRAAGVGGLVQPGGTEVGLALRLENRIADPIVPHEEIPGGRRCTATILLRPDSESSAARLEKHRERSFLDLDTVDRIRPVG